MLRYFRIWRVVLSIVVLIYTFLPYDFLPDMLLGWGWIDDILIIYLLWHYFFRGRKIQPGETDRQGAGQEQNQSGSGSQKTDRTGSAQTVPKNPYDVLEIERGASKEEIKIAYKKLAGKYHPDKVVHLGEEFKVLAEKRFKEIQDAYDALKSSLGGL